MLSFVKPKKDTTMLNLWHWELEFTGRLAGRKTHKVWTLVTKEPFPFEEDDTRFQIACSKIYCSSGSILPFKASESPLKGNLPFYIPDKLLERFRFAKDTPAIADEINIDFSGFWKSYDEKKSREARVEKPVTIKQQIKKGDISSIAAMIRAKKGLT